MTTCAADVDAQEMHVGMKSRNQTLAASQSNKIRNQHQLMSIAIEISTSNEPLSMFRLRRPLPAF